jgi:hypothetical protein
MVWFWPDKPTTAEIWAQGIPLETPPPTLKKSWTKKPPTLRNSGAPSLAGYLLPSPIMATVWDHIEGLIFQKVLEEANQQMKLRFADHFPLRLPDNTTAILYTPPGVPSGSTWTTRTPCGSMWIPSNSEPVHAESMSICVESMSICAESVSFRADYGQLCATCLLTYVPNYSESIHTNSESFHADSDFILWIWIVLVVGFNYITRYYYNKIK